MDKHEFQLSDGVVTGKVVSRSDAKTLTVTFDVSDKSGSKPVLDMDKYRNAVIHQGTIRNMLQQISTRTEIGLPEMTKEGAVELTAHFALQDDFDAAIAALHTLELRNPSLPDSGVAMDGPSLLEELGQQYKDHPQDIPEVAPAIREESSGTHAFLQRILQSKDTAQMRKTLKICAMDNEENGTSASIFPVEKSALTGKQEDKDKLVIAVRITPGATTANPRMDTYRITNEIEKRLMIRGLELRTAEVHHGAQSDGLHDTGIIIVNPSIHPLQTLEKINSIMMEIQQAQDILRLKRGTRLRGADSYSASNAAATKPVQPETDPLEDTIASSIKTAQAAGLIKINGTYPEIAAWVSELATEIRQAQSQQPGRRMGGQSK